MKLFVVIFIILIISSWSIAKIELNFTNFLKLYQENDPDYQKILIEFKRLPFLLDQNFPTKELTLKIINENGINSDNSQNTSLLTGELAKEIKESGTLFSFSHFKSTQPSREENVTELRMKQSLYKNMFGRDARLRKSFLNDDEKIKYLELMEGYEEYILSVLEKFLHLDKAFRDYKLAEQIFNEALNLNKNIQYKRKLKIASDTDFKRSRLLVLLRQEDLIKKKNIFENLKQEITKTIHIDDVSIKEGVVDDLIFFFKKNIHIINGKKDIEKLRSHQIIKLKQSRAKKNIIILERIDAPDFNFIIGYNKDDSKRFSTVSKSNEVIFGFEFEMFFGDSKAEADYQIAKIDLLKVENESKNFFLDINKQIENLQLIISEKKSQLNLNEEKVSLINSILQDEEKRFAIGKIDLEKIIETKNDYATYRIQYEQSKLDYVEILIRWYSLTDKLISLEDIDYL